MSRPAPGPWLGAAGAAVVLSLLGCSLNPALRLDAVVDSPERVELTRVPFHPQEAHQCGPASLLTVLEASGVEAGYDEVVDRVYVPGLEGSLQAELLAAARGYGRVAYPLPPRPEAVLAELSAGRPVLVLLNLGVPSAPVWHYAVVVGFDPGSNRMILRSGRTARSAQKAPAWLRRWDWAGRWAMVLLRPGAWPSAPDRRRLLQALAAFEDAADPAPAKRAWRAATENWPEEPMAWLGLGNAAHRLREWELARQAYRRALSLEPELLAARLNLATTFAEEGRPCEGLEALGARPTESSALWPAFVELSGRLDSACKAESGGSPP